MDAKKTQEIFAIAQNVEHAVQNVYLAPNGMVSASVPFYREAVRDMENGENVLISTIAQAEYVLRHTRAAIDALKAELERYRQLMKEQEL